MESNTTIYKGVPLTNGRTTEMIDTIIEKRGSMRTNEIAELLGFDSFRLVNAICRHLNKENSVTPKAKAPKVPKYIVKEAKNTYSNYHGSGKETARDLIADAIMSTYRQSSNILTLPADKWIMEKNILKKKSGYKFTAVERDTETYQQMMKNMVSDAMLLDCVTATANKTISEVIVNDGEDTYSSAILDYCGFIDTFYDEINDIMKRNLVRKGCYIAITLSENDRILNHSLRENCYSNVYIKKCCANKEINGAEVTNNLVNTLVFTNSGYKIVNKYSYRDKTANMLLFIIKRDEE